MASREEEKVQSEASECVGRGTDSDGRVGWDVD